MTPEQRNKSLSWFRSLPENLQGLQCFDFFLMCFIIIISQPILLLLHFVSTESVLHDAAAATISTQQKEACAANQMTKDDIVHLMHLFKEPMAQSHWSNLFHVLK